MGNKSLALGNGVTCIILAFTFCASHPFIYPLSTSLYTSVYSAKRYHWREKELRGFSFYLKRQTLFFLDVRSGHRWLRNLSGGSCFFSYNFHTCPIPLYAHVWEPNVNNG